MNNDFSTTFKMFTDLIEERVGAGVPLVELYGAVATIFAQVQEAFSTSLGRHRAHLESVKPLTTLPKLPDAP